MESRPWGRSLGFKIISFTPDVAQVLLVEQWAGVGQYLGWGTTLVWTDGDWRLQFLDDGQLSVNGSITVDPNGFTGGSRSRDRTAHAATRRRSVFPPRPEVCTRAEFQQLVATIANATLGPLADVFMNAWAQLEVLFLASWVTARFWWM